MSSSVALDPACADAIAQFRRDGGDERAFIVFGYADPKTLSVLAVGAGALAEAAAHFPAGGAAYALLKSTLQIDRSLTTKFAYVEWTCEQTPPTRKAVLTTHKPQVRVLLQPFHVDLVATDAADIKDGQALIDRKIAAAAGTAINERSMAEGAAAGAYFKAGAGAGSVKKGGASSASASSSSGSSSGSSTGPGAGAGAGIGSGTGVGSAPLPSGVGTRHDAGNALGFEDEAAARAAIRSVRDDACADVNWVLLGYADGKTLRVAASGAGGVDEMAAALDDQQAMYGLFVSTAKFDQSTVTKHGFVRFIGERVPVMRKAALAPHSGFVQSLFEPYHLDFLVNSRDELSTAIATEKIRALMFTNSAAVGNRDQNAASSASASSASSAAASVAKAASGGGASKSVPAMAATAAAAAAIQFTDATEFADALKSVHQSDGALTWMLCAATTPQTLALIATGSEGGADSNVNATVAAVSAHLEPNRPNFALLRLTDVIDGHPTTKFAYICSMPEAVPPMQKARLATTKSAIAAAHQPWHVDFFIENASDISGDAVVAKVGAASGSKNFSK